MVTPHAHDRDSSKTHARSRQTVTPSTPDTAVSIWNNGLRRRTWLSWGLAGGVAGGLWWCGPATAEAAELALEVLAPGLWRVVPAAEGDGSVADRGQVSNLLLAVHGAQGWLVGSGPSPAFGRRLRHTLAARWPGLRWTVISPWAHPEAVLGTAGLGDVNTVGHAEVVWQMAQRCAGCIERLKQRLGAAAVDLGHGNPVRLPATRLTGVRGRLGPFEWWLAARDTRTATTVWLHRASGVAFAPGLLWAGAPDGRDAEIDELAAATARLSTLEGLPADLRWLGEQGPVQDAGAAARTAHYWQALQAAVQRRLDDGDGGETVPPTLPGVPASVTRDPRHALNWQRAWRQAESRWLQRSLR